ncbi:MAG TPA: hypothetical protein VFL04_06840 [Rectinemataceae bacterium]|nr:hypothetical protein [Rectinemataceae bacterium]
MSPALALGIGALAAAPLAAILALRYPGLRRCLGPPGRRAYALRSVCLVLASGSASGLLASGAGGLAWPIVGELALSLAAALLILGLLRRGE